MAGPHDVLNAERAWPLHHASASRIIEAEVQRRWAHGELMAWAGRRVASWIMAVAPHARHVWVAAGPGGNGGDGLYAAAHLASMGRQVDISLHPDQVTSTTQEALSRALSAGCQLVPQPGRQRPDLVVDALLGLGANRPLTAPIAQAVQAMAQLNRPCLSIDIPTGLNPDTGQALGDVVVRAQGTLSLLTLKPGLFMGTGRDAAGRIWLDTLDDSVDGWTAEPVAQTSWALQQPGDRPRAHASHKGLFGDVAIVGGASGMLGAARLAAHAALAAGAGRVIVAPLDPRAPQWDWNRPECMWLRPEALLDEPLLEQATVVCGCGAGTAVTEWLPALLVRAQRVVLDADALNALARQPHMANALRARAMRGQASVLTPHPLEAARLLGVSVPEIQGQRLQAARQLADSFQATVVLKGSGTVTLTPGHLPQVNITGNGALATGGTGDVLAGWLGGRWASQPFAVHEETTLAHRVTCQAVHTHGQAADLQGPRNSIRALELVEAMRQLVT